MYSSLGVVVVHVQFCDHDDFVHACDVLVGLELRVGTLIVLVHGVASRQDCCCPGVSTYSGSWEHSY